MCVCVSYVIYYVCIVGKLTSSTTDAMGTSNFISSTTDITTSGTSPSASINRCIVSPSSTACMMAIEDDDETGNDTICYIRTYVCT